MKIELDMYQTLALAVLVLMLGKFLRERVRLLDKFCIPAPVIGGVLFAIFTCICYVTFENPAMTITKAEIEDWIVEDDKDVTASVTE